MLARPILQVFGAFTVDGICNCYGNRTTLWKSQKLVGRKWTLAQLLGFSIAKVAARLLARPILQEYDAFHS